MAKLEQTLFVPSTDVSLVGNMPAAKLLGMRTHQMPGPEEEKPIIVDTHSCEFQANSVSLNSSSKYQKTTPEYKMAVCVYLLEVRNDLRSQ